MTCKEYFYKERLMALLKALEVENIDTLIDMPVSYIVEVGRVITIKAKKAVEISEKWRDYCLTQSEMSSEMSIVKNMPFTIRVGDNKTITLNEKESKMKVIYEKDIPKPTIILSQKAFDALGTYSWSSPTITTLGKQWKRRKNYRDDSKGWLLGEYVPNDKPNTVGINWMNIEVAEITITSSLE